MTPLLVLLFGIHPATAVGTDLLHAAITKTGGTYVHAKAGPRRLAHHRPARGRKSAGRRGDARRTAACVHRGTRRLEDHYHHARRRAPAHGRRARAALVPAPAGPRPTPIGRRPHPAFTVLTGVVLGFLVSISSVGAGALGVTALFFLYPRFERRAHRRLRSGARRAAHPASPVAVIGCSARVDWALLGSLLVGSLPGIYLGSHFVGRIPDTALRMLLAAMLLLVGAKLISF